MEQIHYLLSLPGEWLHGESLYTIVASTTNPPFHSYLVHLIKILLAAVAGVLIGFEREIREKPVGTKTMLILTVGSCLLTIVSIDGATTLGKGINDPLRMASSIIQGIGFLGGGIILKQSNSVIVGITTATMVWVSSGIGIAIGAGYYYETAITVILMIISVELLPSILKRFGPKSIRQKVLLLDVSTSIDTDPTTVSNYLQSNGLTIVKIKIREEQDALHLTYTLRGSRERTTSSLYKDIRARGGFYKIDIEMID